MTPANRYTRFRAVARFPSKAIEGYQALMHDKYVIVDNGTPNARVETGSTNWTDDSWINEENNIVILHIPGDRGILYERLQ